MLRPCPECAATGWLHRTPFDAVTCWKCIGLKAINDDMGSDESKSNDKTDLKGNSFADIRAQLLSPYGTSL